MKQYSIGLEWANGHQSLEQMLILQNIDPERWADEFVRLLKNHEISAGIKILIEGWFANAMQVVHDRLHTKKIAVLANHLIKTYETNYALDKELQQLRSEIERVNKLNGELIREQRLYNEIRRLNSGGKIIQPTEVGDN